MRIGVAVLTYRGRDHLSRCLPPLRASPLCDKLLVVDSSSEDGTVAVAQALGAETLVIPKAEYNHGLTREFARRHLATDVAVMVSQDAYARDEQMLARLVAPILAGEASVAYGRQVPRAGARSFERFLREFNYPPESNVRDLADADKYGVALSFCSNAFAAWRQTALDEVGGFQRTLSHEDAIASALLLKRGHRVAYVAEAIVEHSHPYSLVGDFQRYFDAGYARTIYRDELEIQGTHAALGARYASDLVRELWHSNPPLLPYAGIHVLAKGSGFAAGKAAVHAPTWFARLLSGQKYYWSSSHHRPAA